MGLGDETGKGSSNFGVEAGIADWDMVIPIPPAIARGDADGGAEVDSDADADACGGKLDDRLTLILGELTPTAARAAASFHPPPNPLALVAVADLDGGPGRL